MKYLEHLVNPERLLVLWQAMDAATNKPVGDRFVVGELREDANGIALQYYDNEDTRKAATERGFKGMTVYPYAPAKKYNGNVEEVLAKRLASPSRSDYADYLRSYRLPPDRADQLTVMQLLAYTGGVLAGDGFSFAHTFDNAQPPFDFTFEIAGFRHNDGMKEFSLAALQNQPVTLAHDPENPHDDHAVAVWHQQTRLGFVPKGMATALVDKIMNQYTMQASITRINGTKDRPSVWVMVEVR